MASGNEPATRPLIEKPSTVESIRQAWLGASAMMNPISFELDQAIRILLDELATATDHAPQVLQQVHRINELTAQLEEAQENSASLTGEGNQLYEQHETLKKRYETLKTRYNALLQKKTTTGEPSGASDERVAALEKELEDTKKINAALAGSAGAQEGKIRELEQELAEARQINLALARSARPNTGSNIKIPDPDKFDGTRAKLRPFLTQLTLKVAGFDDETAKLRYAINCLTGDALVQAQAYVRNGVITFTTLEELTQMLETAFGNPNRVADAENKLASISQGEREFSRYFAEFQRYAAEVTWDESSRLAALKKGLSWRVRNDLVSIQDEPTTLSGFVALCNSLDTKRRALHGSSSYGRTSGVQSGSKPAGGRASTAPTPSYTTPAAPTSSTPSTQSGTHAGPMDLSAGRLTPEEREKCMREGRCFRCKVQGHLGANCPSNSRQPRLRASEATVYEAEEDPSLKD